MLQLSEEKKEYLNRFLPKAQEYIESNKYYDILVDLDDAIIAHFDEDGWPDEVGMKLQNIYLEIVESNPLFS